MVPSVDTTVNNEDVTPEELAAYGFRVAAYAVWANHNKVHVVSDNSLTWNQVLRCLDWQRKWDLVWTEEDNLRKIHAGGSRWHSGEHWDRPRPSAIEEMKKIKGIPGPGFKAFKAKNIQIIDKTSCAEHEHLAVIYTSGVMSGMLENNVQSLVENLKQWKQTGQNDPIVFQLFQEVFPHCLKACDTSLPQLVSSLRKKSELGGEEKMRHATWMEEK